MKLHKCFRILEINPGVPEAQVRQAYKDMVSVWHPDRFENNPRLQKKAEEKIKEVNTAYETIITFRSSQPGTEGGVASDGGGQGKENEYGANVEAFFETGTGIVLNMWGYLSRAAQNILSQIDSTDDAEAHPENKAAKKDMETDTAQ